MTPRLPPACARAYLLVSPLGEGGFGSVWLATQRALDRPVALKLLKDAVLSDEQQVARFRAEARIAAALDHPGIVRVIDHDVEDGVPWIAFEHVQGESLRSLLVRGAMRWPAALRVVSELAAALQCAHDAGVLHRDVKPENVLVSAGRYRLTDFGIARWTSASEVRTATGVVLGTPAYLSPEQIRGQAIGPAADLYALGVLAHELIAGRPPFSPQSLPALLSDHLHRPPPTLSSLVTGVPGAVEELVLTLLAKNPEERCANGAAVVQACEAALAAAPAATPPRSGVTRRVRSAVAARTISVSPHGAQSTSSPRAATRGKLALALAVFCAPFVLLASGALGRHSAPVAAAVSPSAAPAGGLDGPALEAAVRLIDSHLEPLFRPLRSSGDLLGDTITHATPLTAEATRREAAGKSPPRVRGQSQALLAQLPATLARLALPDASASTALSVMWQANTALEHALYFGLDREVSRVFAALPAPPSGQLAWVKAYLECGVERMRGAFLTGRERIPFDRRADELARLTLEELEKRTAVDGAAAQVDAALAVRVQYYHCLGRHGRGALARAQKDACFALLRQTCDRGADPWTRRVCADIHDSLARWVTNKDGVTERQ